MSYIDPDDIGDVDQLSYQHLVWRFIGRQKRLAFFKKLKTPPQIIEAEENLIQKAYNQMREKCMKDEEYKALWENENE